MIRVVRSPYCVRGAAPCSSSQLLGSLEGITAWNDGCFTFVASLLGFIIYYSRLKGNLRMISGNFWSQVLLVVMFVFVVGLLRLGDVIMMASKLKRSKYTWSITLISIVELVGVVFIINLGNGNLLGSIIGFAALILFIDTVSRWRSGNWTIGLQKHAMRLAVGG